MNLNRHTRQYARIIFRDYAEDISVYLRSSLSKGDNYNPNYNVAFTKTSQNPLTVKAVIRDADSDKLIIQHLGLIAVGAKTVVVRDADVDTLKLAERITIKDVDYEAYNESLGRKFQVYDVQFGYSKVMLFKKGN